MKPVIVISAHRSFLRSGAITITGECLTYLAQRYKDEFQLKALVYQKELYPSLPQVEYIEFPHARKSALYRLYYEYVYFKKLSKKWQPHLWLSMQDSTPNVQAKNRVVYLHNALPVEPLSWNYLKKSFHFFLLHFLYRYIYPLGIRRNNWIVVQQKALADKLSARFSIPGNKILLFPAEIEMYSSRFSARTESFKTYTFIYPATAFPHRNFEVIVSAVRILNNKDIHDFEVIFTSDGKENSYARGLKKQSSNNITFKPFMPPNELNDVYKRTDCLLFPSLVESWGLPLSEFIQMNKPILAADLPYAHETTSGFEKAKFFDPHNPEQLAEYMLQAMKGELIFDKNIVAPTDKYETVYNWKQLFDKILQTTP